MHWRISLVVAAMLVLMLAESGMTESRLPAPVSPEDRCPVCGMKVAKYPEWLAQVELVDGRVLKFDGPKDMLAFYFAPEDYGESGSGAASLAVREYYRQEWLDGRKAFYVIGSDVLGPMGHEFVPFASREAAENFSRDHHGNRILTFDEITLELVQDMQKGHKMKGHMGHK